ncbi:hypothetical protein OBBRIDRAFT_886830 [Obba rivulosa]|uniref:Uncharacterized protein n=1 Tax=Obba rivulosa TaxID=1052685 RepID=A0A8E2AV66_9APHY|nr:hypothetical protein OBBRIDRAFT_886830 [Obba rivulosa]
MYLTSPHGSGYHSLAAYGARRAARNPPAPPTSIPLDDAFDAVTTEVPTEWTAGDGHRDYEESVTGYQNFVREMERKLSREHEYFETAYPSPVPPPRVSTSAQKVKEKAREKENARVRGSVVEGSIHRRASVGHAASPEIVRRVSGRKGLIELVEHKVMEDNSERTISLWRERVAQSSAESPFADDQRSVANSHAHRRMSSYDSRDRRGPSDKTRKGEVVARSNVRKDATVCKPNKHSYERSEYMVTYRQPVQGNSYSQAMYAHSEIGQSTPRSPTAIFSPPRQKVALPTPQSPSIRRTSGRSTFERTEYMVTYPNTPPKSTSSPGSSPNAVPQKIAGAPHELPMSPSGRRQHFPMPTGASNSTRATSTSSVELILSSCEPSLLHIAPALMELGIYRTEHLRAVARLSEETRNREVKEQALKKGVTVMEWAILLDRLLAL